MDAGELRAYRRLARRKGLTLSEWVRDTLRDAQREESAGPAERKVAVIRTAARHCFPVPDIDDMLAEIERGYHQRIAD